MNELMIKDEMAVLEFEKAKWDFMHVKAEALISSEVLPPHFRTIGSVITLYEVERITGLPLLMIGQQMSLIKGKVFMSGQMTTALINKSGKFDDVMDWEVIDEDKPTWKVRAYNTLKGKKLYSEWMSASIAERAGLTRNAVWRQFPIRMAKYNTARTFARDYAPEVLMGFSGEDEAIYKDDVNIIDEEAKEKVVEVERGISQRLAEKEPQESAESVEVEIVTDSVPEPVKSAEEQDGVAELAEVMGAEMQNAKDEKPKFKRAPKKVVEAYNMFMEFGVKRGHLPSFVRFHNIDEDSVLMVKRKIEKYVWEFYQEMKDFKPSKEIFPPKDSQQIKLDKPEQKEIIEPAVIEEDLVGLSEAVTSKFPEMIAKGVKRFELFPICQYYKLTEKNIEPFMDNLERMVNEYRGLKELGGY